MLESKEIGYTLLPTLQCPICGGKLIGDGNTHVVQCEFAPSELTDNVEPDAGPIYCETKSHAD